MPQKNRGKRPNQERQIDRVGTEHWGAPGGHPGGTIDVCAFALAQNFARIYGCEMADAYRAVMAMGLAAHQLLIRGEPVGFPHVGVLYIGRKLCPSYMGKGPRGQLRVRANGLAPRGFEPAARFRSPYFVNCIRLFQPRPLREYMAKHMPRNGTKVQQIARARERFRTVLRRNVDGGIAHKPRKRAQREHQKRLALL